MPIFRLDGDKLIIAQETNLELEKHLEDWLENSPWAVITDFTVLTREDTLTGEDVVKGFACPVAQLFE